MECENEKIKCPRCSGQGKISCPACDRSNVKTEITQFSSCARCLGKGEIICPLCNGSGEIENN